jgi:3-phytase
MRVLGPLASLLALSRASIASSHPATANLSISALTAEVESDWTAIYYGSKQRDSLLLGNDGSAGTGGFRSYDLFDRSLNETGRRTPGRTKVVGVLYGVGRRDLLVSITATESLIRLYDIDGLKEIPGAQKTALGDWSSLCTWRSPRGADYFYLFGKKQAVQFLVREDWKEVKILEVDSYLHHHVSFDVRKADWFRSKLSQYPLSPALALLIRRGSFIWLLKRRRSTRSRPQNLPRLPR